MKEITALVLSGIREANQIEKKESSAKKRSPTTFAYSLATTAKCIIILCTFFFPVIIFPYSCC